MNEDMNILDGFREDLKLFTQTDALMVLGALVMALCLTGPLIIYVVANAMVIGLFYATISFLVTIPFLYILARAFWRKEVAYQRNWNRIMNNWEARNKRLGIFTPRLQEG